MTMAVVIKLQASRRRNLIVALRPLPRSAIWRLCGNYPGRRRPGTSPAQTRTTEDQRCISAAEPERVRQHVVDPALPRLVRHEVDVAGGRRIVEVEGRRDHIVAQRQDREYRLGAAGSAEQMADRRFG